MRSTMKLIALLVVLALSAGGGAVFAGCGHKETVEGTLKSMDADSNKVVVVVGGEDGKEVELSLTAETQVKDTEGNDTEVSKLVGKSVKVVSEHAQVDSITQTA